MENKINKKLETYLSNYREMIKAKIMDIVDDDDVQNVYTNLKFTD